LNQFGPFGLEVFEVCLYGLAGVFFLVELEAKVFVLLFEGVNFVFVSLQFGEHFLLERWLITEDNRLTNGFCVLKKRLDDVLIIRVKLLQRRLKPFEHVCVLLRKHPHNQREQLNGLLNTAHTQLNIVDFHLRDVRHQVSLIVFNNRVTYCLDVGDSCGEG
jgi:hypothetical protein